MPRASARLRSAAALFLLLGAFGCATRKDERLPTLEDYSDGTSGWADALLAGWKSGDPPEDLFGAPTTWSGPLPGEGMQKAPAAALLSVENYAAPAMPSAP